MEIPRELFLVWWGAVGLMVGSFLNVAIHRLPLDDETLGRPRHSRCPSCKHQLSWRENVPLLSWVLQRGRCRWCSWRIPWRYPFVELLTAGLWVLGASLAGAWQLGIVVNVVLAGLIVATFVDFEHFEIPDEVSIGGIVLAPVASFLVPVLHDQTWIARQLSDVAADGTVDRTGALIGSLAGVAVGGGSLMLLGWVGKRLYGREAMGFGDVKLLAAGGGFVGPGGALVAFLAGTLIASIVGVANILRFLVLARTRARRRQATKSFGRSLRVARVAGRYIPFGPYLGIGIGIVLLAWKDVMRLSRELLF